MKYLNKVVSAVLSLALLAGGVLPVVTQAAPSFSDVKGHWAASYITKGVERGYLSGYENGTFQPDASVTRAEFCKMLNGALSLKQSSTSAGFGDVNSSLWYNKEVNTAVSAGYISGYEEDNTFRGNHKISRQEAAVVISRIATESNSTGDYNNLRDKNDIDAWATDGVKQVCGKGYMTGDNNKKMNPKGNLSRAEAAKIIESLLAGETLNQKDVSQNANSQSYYDTVFSGDVVLNAGSSNSNVTFSNCRIMGTLQINGTGTVTLKNVKAGNVVLGANASDVTLTLSGKTSVKHLTSSAKTVALSGDFHRVTLSKATNLSLKSGSIQKLMVESGAKGSTIDLASGTTVARADISGASDFTGRGIITLANQNVNGST